MQGRHPPDARSWSQRWRRWLTTLGLASATRAALRIKRLEVTTGCIRAAVQTRSGQIHDVEIRFPLWSDREWHTIVDALGSQALYAAQLLAGDVPPELERTLTAAGVELLPTTARDLCFHCSCTPDHHQACEHAGAALAALGELLPEDPWLLFRLRGRDQQALLHALQAQRVRPTESGPSQLAKPDARRSGFYRAGSGAAESSPDLRQELDSYWGNSKALEDFRPHLFVPPVELVLLRRLGVPPLEGAGVEVYDQLAALYRRIRQETLNLAYAGDNGETAGTDNASAK